MRLFRLIYSTFLEALFPASRAEREVFSYTPEEAFMKLPRAPAFDNAVDFKDMRAIFAYKDERVSRLVWAIKYKRMEMAVKIGGYALLKTLDSMVNGKTIILPMPITDKRRRERGYNQCELLVDELKRLSPQLRVESSLLKRVHHTSRQTLKDREERLESAKGLFMVYKDVVAGLIKNNPQLMDDQIIIIDDVITTGSTMREAMETLRLAGFLNVRGLALGH